MNEKEQDVTDDTHNKTKLSIPANSLSAIFIIQPNWCLTSGESFLAQSLDSY